jgi:hypothetical protein
MEIDVIESNPVSEYLGRYWGAKKFVPSALSHPIVRAYHNERKHSTENLLLFNFSFKEIVTPTASTSALVLKTSMRVCTFRIFMKHQVVIRLLTLKGLRASVIAAELQPVYEIEALAISPTKK